MTASPQAGLRPALLVALPVCVLLAACLGDNSPIEVEVPECTPPVADTTGWVRTGGAVSILLPPEFEQIDTNRWERGGTRVTLTIVTAGDPPFIPFESWNYAGSCTAWIRDRRVVIDYGGVSSGGPTPDLGIAAAWRLVALPASTGDIILSAQARDHSDRAVVEAAIWSLHVTSGPPTL